MFVTPRNTSIRQQSAALVLAGNMPGHGRRQSKVRGQPFHVANRMNEETFKLRRVLVERKLVLRKSKFLDSERIGDIPRGTMILVVDEDLVGNVIRCQVGKDSSPRGVCVHNLGWVTAARDGELKLLPVPEGEGLPSAGSSPVAVGSPGSHGSPSSPNSKPSSPDCSEQDADASMGPPWSLRLLAKLEAAQIDPSFSRLCMPSSMRDGQQGSMASRIANIRLEKQRRASVRKGDVGALENTPALDAPQEASKKDAQAPPTEAKFVWSSSIELTELADKIAADADHQEFSAHAKFDTVEAKLGRLLNERKIKLEELMIEWDRNKDGDISKQEFRLHVKKLGMDTATPDIDALYDSLDLDGSGSLDLDEMKFALKRMQDDVRNVRESVKRVLEHATQLREVAGLFRTAVVNTHTLEAARRRLEAMREVAREESPAVRLAAAMTAKNLTIADMNIGGWVADDKQYASKDAFAHAFERLEAEVSEKEIESLLKKFDINNDETLELEEVGKLLHTASNRTTAAIQAMRKADGVQVKVISSAKSTAEASQKEARGAMLRAETEAAAREASMQKEKEEKRRAEAKAKAEELAQKKSKKATTIAKFMSE